MCDHSNESIEQYLPVVLFLFCFCFFVLYKVVLIFEFVDEYILTYSICCFALFNFFVTQDILSGFCWWKTALRLKKKSRKSF